MSTSAGVHSSMSERVAEVWAATTFMAFS